MEDGDDATTPLAMNPDTPITTSSTSSPTTSNHDPKNHHKDQHAKTGRSRSGSAASASSNHRRNVSSSLLSKLSFLRTSNHTASPEQQSGRAGAGAGGGYRNETAVNERGAGHDGGGGDGGGDEGDDDGNGAEGDNDVPGSAPGMGMRGGKAMTTALQQQQQQQQQRRTRRRRGSLRKTALLGTRLESKKLNRGGYSTVTNNNGNNNDDDGDDENDGSGQHQHQHGLTMRSFGESSDTNSPRRGYIGPAQQQQQQQQKPLRGRSSGILGDETGTDDETTSAVQRNHLGTASSTDSYFALPTADTTAAAAAAVHRTKSLTHHHHPLLHHHHHAAAEINHADIPWDYSDTEWWGWIILIVTWLVFVVGMGSCFGVWSWAWDVGETPYAPPELEDDPTLPIVGYYPALIILTAVMSWVWVVVAWVGMKYFKHANISGEEI